uniref:Uncharacterized protein n=1 Tax=biofilter metagenome TaxID=1070537 RepID=A0A193SD50_9ZZZZ
MHLGGQLQKGLFKSSKGPILPEQLVVFLRGAHRFAVSGIQGFLASKARKHATMQFEHGRAGAG